jgi:hypothetical protein
LVVLVPDGGGGAAGDVIPGAVDDAGGFDVFGGCEVVDVPAGRVVEACGAIAGTCAAGRRCLGVSRASRARCRAAASARRARRRSRRAIRAYGSPSSPALFAAFDVRACPGVLGSGLGGRSNDDTAFGCGTGDAVPEAPNAAISAANVAIATIDNTSTARTAPTRASWALMAPPRWWSTRR